MPKMSHISIDQYVTIQALNYPSLYGTRSFESAKLAVLDHLISTIGNGISFEQLLNDIKWNKQNKEILAQGSTHLFDGTKMYYIKKVSEGKERYSQNSLFNPETGKEVFTLTMAEIQKFGWDNPKEYEWYESALKNQEEWSPYPFFEKEYSILWENEEELHNLPLDFLKAFVEYYKITLDFFTTDKQYFYHYACPNPSDENKWKQKLIDWQGVYEKYTAAIEGEENKMKTFSEGYGEVYNGNMREFLERRHTSMIKECVDFINETILMLEKKIAEK